ncbi:MAG: hypothetical protein D6675_04380 [Gemmatimonadetes bacterium]|nr:MAG: hypothetical protein D6675_04380 [Gemmatimonadota bacterium]
MMFPRIILLLILLAMIISCAPRPVVIQNEPPILHGNPPRRIVPERQHLPRALMGKKIVIDPGHGGKFPGAIGESGLRECDVNLAVALLLADRLQSAGAAVILTRLKDVHLADELREDLQYRCDVAQKKAADLFVSIHHNSLPERLPSFNQTETYYQLRDPGSSRDLAASIHYHLLKALDSQDGGLIPGNQYVIRNVTCTAILGEAVYLSNRRMERKLRNPRFLQQEADAYFNGIWEYFARRIPVIEAVSPADSAVIFTSQPLISGYIRDGASPADAIGEEGIDPASIELYLNDTPYPVDYDPVTHRFTCRPQLKSGEYRLQITARNRAGNSTRAYSGYFQVRLAPSQLSLELTPAVISAPMPVGVFVQARFDGGYPVGKSPAVVFSSDVGSFSQDTLMLNPHGIASTTYYPPLNLRSTAARLWIHATCQGRTATAEMVTVHDDSTSQQWLWGTVVDPAGTPLPQTELCFGDDLACYRVRDDGGFTIPLPQNARERPHLTVSAPGYLTVFLARYESNRSLRIGLEPLFQGVLRGKRILFDVATSQLAPITSNLHNFGLLTEIVTGNEVQNVAASLRFMPHLYLLCEAVTSDPPGVWVYHYPGSQNGERLAHLLQAYLSKFLSCRVGESTQYQLAQTACPAVQIRVSSSFGEVEMDRLRAALVYSLAEYFGATHTQSFTCRGYVRDGMNHPLKDIPVTLTGQPVQWTDNSGYYAFPFLAAGDYEVSVAEISLGRITVDRDKMVDFRVEFDE